MTDLAASTALIPIIVLLLLGVVTAIGSRAAALSPIVGYLALGVGLSLSGFQLLIEESTTSLLAEVGVVFLLFDIGLHFSLTHIRKQASDIFVFGPSQVLLAAIALGVTGLTLRLSILPTFLTAGILALSSTAVVGHLIGERHQQNCPVGLTATSILIFQDVAAIFLLIIANSLEGGGPVRIVATVALLKGGIAFIVTVLVARLFIGPLLHLVARTRNDEVFTAVTLLIALSAAWATGQVGLSLTLGAFLGGVALAETPYRAVVASEIKPFRALLLGFFFISIGLSLDVSVLTKSWLVILCLTVLMLTVKILANIVASRIFRWSIPGSIQLGFLLAQGSEFAFVILSLPAVRTIIGAPRVSVITAVVALSIAVTPNLAKLGRSIAGRMRVRSQRNFDREITSRNSAAPVIIVGMGAIGRTVANALIHFGIGYVAVERDELRLQEAIADGYNTVFGDGFDIRMWDPVALHERRLSVLTAPDLGTLAQTRPLVIEKYPDLKRFTAAQDEAEAKGLRDIGLIPIVDRSSHPGIDVAKAVLTELGIGAAAIANWGANEQDAAIRATRASSLAF